MKKNDTFITKAMLASYMSIESKDYLSLIIPFILNCLPDEKDEKIEVNEIQKSLNDKYNLDILCNVVEKLLQKCCKEKNGAYVKRKNGSYLLNKPYDSKEFDLKKEKIKESLDNVILNMKNYLINEKGLTETTSETAKSYLSNFLDTYNYTIYENTECAHTITINDKNSKTNYYVAQFILSEYKKESNVFNYILEIIKGTLVTKSIYFFMYKDNSDFMKKICGTVFYLDTRLLIEALGLNLSYEQSAMKELMKIITENGGKLKTFNHYIEELKGILYKYVRDPMSRTSLSLMKFNVDKYSSIDAKLYMDTVESRISEMGIECEEKPEYIENIDKHDWHIDYIELRNKLSASIEYGNNKGGQYSDSLTHDADTIEAIAFFRGKSKRCSVMDCKSIFVTKNREIVNVIYKLYYQDRFKEGEINFVITDIDLTAILWLSTFGKQSDLPKLKLLENVYAACSPSNAVMKTFLNKIKCMEENEKISTEEALLLRTQYSMVEDLVELSGNSSTDISESTIIEMYARLVNRERKTATIEAQEKVKTDKKEIENEKFNLLKEKNKIEEKKEDLIILERRILKEKEDNEIINNRLENQRRRNEVEKNKNDKALAHIKNEKDKVINKAIKKAKKAKNIFRFLSIVTVLLFFIITIFIFSFATLALTNFEIKEHIIAHIIVFLISVISVIVTLYSFKKHILIFILRIEENIYAKIYSMHIEKNRNYFEE